MKKIITAVFLLISYCSFSQWAQDTNATTGYFYKLRAYNLSGLGALPVYVDNNGYLTTGSALSGTGFVKLAGTSISYVPTLGISEGGTNNGSLSVTAGTVYYGDGTKLIGLAPGTANQILHGGTSPSWKDTTAAGGGGGSPAGNYGNIQLNRNSVFATPASDSLTFSAGLSVKNLIYNGSTADVALRLRGNKATSGNNVGVSNIILQSGDVGTGDTAAIFYNDKNIVLGKYSVAAINVDTLPRVSFSTRYYGNTAGSANSNKWILYGSPTTPSSTDYGIGMYSGFMQFWAGNTGGGGGFAFYSNGGTHAMDITSAGQVQPLQGLAVTGAVTATGNFTMGTTTPSGSGSPLVFSEGATYGTNAAGSALNLKWRLYDDGTAANYYGIGMSASLMDIHVGAGAGIQMSTNNGTKGIGITSAQVVSMPHYGAGTATFDASGNISSVSDIRLKTNIHPFTTGLKALMNITPITYKWNEKSGNEMDSTYAGFSAQNIQANIPHGTGVSADGYLSLQDRAIVATLVNAVKEQQQEIEDLKNEIKQLKNE